MKKIITTVFAICASASLFGQTVPTNGLKARYSFDDSKYNDVSGNKNNLKESAHKDSVHLHTYTLTKGKVGNCLNTKIELESGLTELDSNGSFKFTDAFTISAWVFFNYDSIIGNAFIVANRCEGFLKKAFIYNNYALWISKRNKKVEFTVNDVILSTSEISDNSWHHIIVTYNSSEAQIYIDGALNATSSVFPRIISTYNLESDNPFRGKLQIGSLYATGASQSNSLIDDLYLYDRAISTAEANQIYNYNGKSSSIALNTINKLQIYPNPAPHFLQVSGLKDIQTALIINNLGQTTEVNVLNNTITIDNLASGVYSIQTKDTFGNVYSNKFIKE